MNPFYLTTFPWIQTIVPLTLLLALYPFRGRMGSLLLFAVAGFSSCQLLSRGLAISFVPLTSPFESFLVLATMLALWTAATWNTLHRPGKRLMLLLTAGFYSGALFFGRELHFPSPMLYTVWYALHVPLSFAAYALWFAAAAHAVDYLRGETDLPAFSSRSLGTLRGAFVLFGLAMILGGIWGLVSWGAWFLWDAKILWSIALWVYGSTLIHVFVSRSYAPWLRALLLLALVPIILITFVGTSFFTGSVHRF